MYNKTNPARKVVLEIGSEHETFDGVIRVLDRNQIKGETIITYVFVEDDLEAKHQAKEPALYNRVYRFRKAQEREKSNVHKEKAEENELKALRKTVEAMQLDIKSMALKIDTLVNLIVKENK